MVNYHSCICMCSVEKSRCCSLQLGLKNGAEESHTIETYDFNMVLKTPAATTAGERKRSEVDIRVKLEGGRLSIVMVKLNERKLVTFENICLHRYVFEDNVCMILKMCLCVHAVVIAMTLL